MKDVPRLEEVKRFYICTKSPGLSRNLTVQYYITSSAPVLKVFEYLYIRLLYIFFILLKAKICFPFPEIFKKTDCISPDQELSVWRRRGRMRLLPIKRPDSSVGLSHQTLQWRNQEVPKEKNLHLLLFQICLCVWEEKSIQFFYSNVETFK